VLSELHYIFCMHNKLWLHFSFQFAKKVCHKSMIPSVMLNVSQTLTQLGTAAIVPILGNEVVTFRRHEGAFSLAVMGFGWLCTSICAPCFLLPVTKRQKGLIASVLFFISSIGFSRKYIKYKFGQFYLFISNTSQKYRKNLHFLLNNWCQIKNISYFIDLLNQFRSSLKSWISRPPHAGMHCSRNVSRCHHKYNPSHSQFTLGKCFDQSSNPELH